MEKNGIVLVDFERVYVLKMIAEDRMPGKRQLKHALIAYQTKFSLLIVITARDSATGQSYCSRRT